MIRLLLITPEIPWPLDQGGRIATFNLYLKGLSAAGYEVHAVIPAPRGRPRFEHILKNYCREVTFVEHTDGDLAAVRNIVSSAFTLVPYATYKFIPPALARVVTDLSTSGNFDIAVFDHQHSAGVLDGPLPIPTVVHFHNVNSLLYRRIMSVSGFSVRGAHSLAQAQLSSRFEKRLVRRIDGAVVASDHDGQVLRSYLPGLPVHTVPFGVDTRSFSASHEEIEGGAYHDGSGPLIVVTGSMDYFPNVDGVRVLSKQVMPWVWRDFPTARVAIVGRGPGQSVRKLARDRRVSVIGRVDDVRPFIRAASVVPVVLRVGSGTRLKALEAAAMGKAIVGSRIGLEGLEFTHGVDALIADDPKEVASAISRLMASPLLREALGANARRLVEEKYSWEASVTRLDGALRSCIARVRARRFA